MEHPSVNFNIPTFGKEFAAFIRARAIKFGSFLVYEENGQIIQEDPRTGQKTIIQSVEKK